MTKYDESRKMYYQSNLTCRLCIFGLGSLMDGCPCRSGCGIVTKWPSGCRWDVGWSE